MPTVVFIHEDDVENVLSSIRSMIRLEKNPTFERGFALYEERKDTYCQFVVREGRVRYEIYAKVEFLDDSIELPEIKSVYPMRYRRYRNFAFAQEEEHNLFERLEKLYEQLCKTISADSFYKTAESASANFREIKEEIAKAYPSLVGLPGAILGFTLVYYFGDQIPYLPEYAPVPLEILGVGAGGFLNTMYWRRRAVNKERASSRKRILREIDNLEALLKD